MTDTVEKWELLLSDMSDPLAHMAQAYEALGRAAIPGDVLEWLGVSDDIYARLEESCNDAEAAIDAAERCALAACDGGDDDAFVLSVNEIIGALGAVEVPGAAEVDEWVKSLTAAFEMRLRNGCDDLLEASVRLRSAKEVAVKALEDSLR